MTLVGGPGANRRTPSTVKYDAFRKAGGDTLPKVP